MIIFRISESEIESIFFHIGDENDQTCLNLNEKKLVLIYFKDRPFAIQHKINEKQKLRIFISFQK